MMTEKYEEVLDIWEDPASPHYDPNFEAEVADRVGRGEAANQDRQRARIEARREPPLVRIAPRGFADPLSGWRMTNADIAVELSVSISTVSKLIRSGQLGSTTDRPGGSSRVTAQAVRDLVAFNPDRFPKRRSR